MLVEIHMLKNYAPTNLNRDDSGSPKTCMFGDVQRGRVSSQCLKHSWRTSELLRDAVGSDKLGIRTRMLPEMVAEKLRADGIDDEIIDVVAKKLTGIGNKNGKEQKENLTGQVIFYSNEDVEAVIKWVKDYIQSCKGDKKKIKNLSVKELEEALKKNNKRYIPLDMALFGRMVTSDAFADVEASMQVAQAISTNRIMMESDFFTAVDDILFDADGKTRSAMMGDIDYNSSCYYLYAAIDTDKLSENMSITNDDKLVEKILHVLIETMVFTNPSGKQNSFAGHSLPSAVLVECKKKRIQVSYANAFEVPVRANNGGLVVNSIQALLQECETIHKKYEIPVEQRLWFTTKENMVIDAEIGTNCSSFSELIGKLNVGGK